MYVQRVFRLADSDAHTKYHTHREPVLYSYKVKGRSHKVNMWAVSVSALAYIFNNTRLQEVQVTVTSHIGVEFCRADDLNRAFIEEMILQDMLAKG